MNKQLSDYLEVMNDSYDSLLVKIQDKYKIDGKNELLLFMLNNNQEIKMYVNNLAIGANLESEKDNQIAYRKTYDKHISFMTEFYKMIDK